MHHILFQRLRALGKSRIISSTLFILVVVSVSWVIMALVQPDRFLSHTLSFGRTGDEEFILFQTFNFLSNLLHGGMALWDPYAQMPLAYYYLGGGYLQGNVTFTSFVYIVYSRLFGSSSHGFYAIYSMVFPIIPMVIRSFGSFLLARRWVSDKRALFLLLVLGNTAIAPLFYLAYATQNGFVYSLYPLMLHYILRLFETKLLRYGLIFLLLWAVAIGSHPIVGIGILYQSIHIFVLCLLAFSLVGSLRHLRFNFRIPSFGKKNIVQLIIVAIIGGSIVWPVGYLYKNYKDYDFGTVENRFSNINLFNPNTYFENAKLGEEYYPAETIRYGFINFESGPSRDWWYHGSWFYMGFTILFFSIVGLIMGTDKKRLIFLSAILFMYFLNSLRNTTGISLVAQWIIALTNPLKFVLRTMSGPSQMIPFLFLALAASGFHQLLVIKTHRNIKRVFQIVLVLVGTVCIPLFAWSYISDSVKWFLIIQSIFAVAILFVSQIGQSSKRMFLIITLCIAMIVMDEGGLERYLNKSRDELRVVPYTFVAGSEKAIVDYQNPEALPFRSYYNNDKVTLLPTYGVTNPIRKGQTFYYSYTDFDQLLVRGDPYYPKHAKYKVLTDSADWDRYIRSENTRIIFDAQYAVENGAGRFSEILDKGWERDVITVENTNTTQGKVLPELPSALVVKPAPHVSFSTQEWTGSQGHMLERNGLRWYEFLLPADFPFHLTSSLFAGDRELLTVEVDGQTYQPAQGELIAPGTFDVGNTFSKRLVIAQRVSDPTPLKIQLMYATSFPNGITKLEHFQPDSIKFSYTMENDGWLVMQYPFDPKWKFRVDGDTVSVTQVNQAFMGIPLSKGTHTVGLEYWPNPFLRYSLLVSALLILCLPFVLFWYGIWDDQRYIIRS